MSQSSDSWQCGLCNYINLSSVKSCEMCDTVQENKLQIRHKMNNNINTEVTQPMYMTYNNQSHSNIDDIDVKQQTNTTQPPPIVNIPSDHQKSSNSRRIKNWSNQDLLNWVKSIGLQDIWENIMKQCITSTGCTGRDWLSMQHYRDLAKLLGMKQTMLASKVFREFKKVKQAEPQDNELYPQRRTVFLWESKHINMWTRKELQEWICNLNLQKSIEKIVVEGIAAHEISGEDFNSLMNVEEVQNSFEIQKTVAHKIYVAMQKVRNNNVSRNNKQPEHNSNQNQKLVKVEFEVGQKIEAKDGGWHNAIIKEVGYNRCGERVVKVGWLLDKWADERWDKICVEDQWDKRIRDPKSRLPYSKLSAMQYTNDILNIVEKLKKLKREGNACFKKQNYKAAVTFYTQAIDDKIYEGNISDITPLIELRQLLLLNRAKSHFLLNHLKDALIDSCNCIKTHNGTKLSYKAHYVCAEIYQSLGDFKNAIKHSDRILNEKNPTLGISALQNRTKKFKKHIKEKSSKKSKHRSHRPNNIIETTEVETTELKKKVLSLEKALISVRDERDQIQQQTVEQKLQINAIEHEKQQLQTQTDRLRKMNLSNLSEIKSLQQQNNELLDDKKEYELKINELMDEISKLQRIDETMYENWSHKEILAWIVSLDNGRFEKYEDELLRNLREEEIQGNDLNGVNEIDLKSWGVKNFKDKKLLLTKIKELTEQNNFNVNNINEEGVATAII